MIESPRPVPPVVIMRPTPASAHWLRVRSITLRSSGTTAEIAQATGEQLPDGVTFEQGAVVLRVMDDGPGIPPDEVASVRESVADCVREHSSLPPPQGYATGFLRLNQSIAPYLAHPRLMAVVDYLFGEFPRISMLTGAINAPGIKRGEVHADWPFNQNSKSRVRAPYPDAVMTTFPRACPSSRYRIASATSLSG